MRLLSHSAVGFPELLSGRNFSSWELLTDCLRFGLTGKLKLQISIKAVLRLSPVGNMF